jgi:hypothetical protein
MALPLSHHAGPRLQDRGPLADSHKGGGSGPPPPAGCHPVGPPEALGCPRPGRWLAGGGRGRGHRTPRTAPAARARPPRAGPQLATRPGGEALPGRRGGPCPVALSTVATGGDLPRLEPPRPRRRNLGRTPSADAQGTRHRPGGLTQDTEPLVPGLRRNAVAPVPRSRRGPGGLAAATA